MLEILISIGVVGIGLLGVAALIPLAHHRAMQGIRDDRKAVVGKRAYRDFQVRGFDRPGTLTSPHWADPLAIYNNGGVLHYRPDVVAQASSPRRFYGLDGRIIRQPYCLDPWMISVHPEVVVFPADPNYPHMARLTLLAGPPMITRRTGAPPTYVAMNRTQVEELFKGDELLIEKPEEVTQPLEPHFLRNVDGQVEKRMTGMSFTWMATLVPEPEPANLQSDLYRLSVVVFHQRPEDDSSGPDPTKEYVLPVLDFLAAGMGGGDVLVGPTPQDVKIKVGQWLMLGRSTGQVNSHGVPQRTFAWYRIQSASQDDVTGQWDLSLSGPDWAVQAATYVSLPPDRKTYATYVPGAVAVYQKTVRLEDNSLYTF